MPRQLYPGGPEVPTLEKMRAALDGGDEVSFTFNDRLGMEFTMMRVQSLLNSGYSLGDCTITIYSSLYSQEGAS